MQTAVIEEVDFTSDSDVAAPVSLQQKPKRWITPESARALEKLGHAIEYLIGQHALTAEKIGRIDSGDPQVEAVHILVAANREAYFSCPTIQPLGRRIGHWVRRRCRRRSPRGDCRS